MIAPPLGHAPDSIVLLVVSATLPAPPAMAMSVPGMKSGVGSGDPTAAWLASWIKK